MIDLAFEQSHAFNGANKMALVNVSVYYNAPSSTNIPWTIHQLEDDRITLKQLYVHDTCSYMHRLYNI